MAQAIYIVEDESIVALDIEARLRRMGFEVAGQSRAAESAVDEIGRLRPDLVLMDVQLRGQMDGIQAAAIVREQFDVPVVFLTAYSDSASLERATKTNAYGYLLKPFQERELLIAIQMATSKHATERQLRHTRAVMDTTLNALSEGVLSTGPDSNVRFINRAAEIMIGVGAAAVLDRPIASVLRTEPAIADFVVSDEQLIWARLITAEGKRLPVEIHRRALGEGHEHAVSAVPSGDVFVIRDVSQLREYQRNLLIAKDAAEAAARAKTEFLANMSHELRTPLTSVVGMAALVQEQVTDPELREMMRILKTSADSLLVLVNNVLDFAKIDSDRNTVRNELFDLVRTVEETVQTHAAAASAKRLNLLMCADPSIPLELYGDAGRLSQIVNNLVSNAIKFTDAGSILVDVWYERNAEEEATPSGVNPHRTVRVGLAVQDTGCGIPADQRGRVFEAFTQVNSSARRSAGGTGLGLSIVKRLVTALKGGIELQSEPGNGSRFTVSVPLVPATTQAPPAEAPSYGSLRRCVVTDEFLAAVVRRLLPSVTTVLADNTDSETDLVIEAVGGKLHVTAPVTRAASGAPAAVELALPVARSAFYSALDGLFRDTATVPVEYANQEESAVASGFDVLGTVLLVDDNSINRRVSSALVQQCGFTVHECSSAAEALQRCVDQSFDILLLDIQMPTMDGFELAAALRDAGTYAHMMNASVVALTAHTDDATRARAVSASFDGFVGKPFSVAQLEIQLHIALDHAKQRLGRGSVIDDTPRIPGSLLARIPLYAHGGRLDHLADLSRELQHRFRDGLLKEHMFRLTLAARRRDMDACKKIAATIAATEGVTDAILDS